MKERLYLYPTGGGHSHYPDYRHIRHGDEHDVGILENPGRHGNQLEPCVQTCDTT